MKMKYSLREKWVLYNNIDLIVELNQIKIIKSSNGKEEVLVYISKSDAIIILMFDGKNTISDIIQCTGKLFDLSNEDAKNKVLNLMNVFSNILTSNVAEIKDRSEQYNEVVASLHKRNKRIEKLAAPSRWRAKTPKNLVIFLTDLCSSKCSYCCVGACQPKTFNSLSYDQVEKLIDQAKMLGVESVELTGGDPMVHPKIMEIIELIINNGIELIISTKHAMNEKFLKGLVKVGLKKIQISLDTIDSNLYEKLIGKDSKNLEITLKNIDFFIKNNIQCKVKSIIIDQNIQTIPSMIEELYKRNVRHFMVQAYNKGSCHDDSFYSDIDDFCKMDKYLDEISSKYEDILIEKGYKIEKITGSYDYMKVTRMYCMAGKTGLAVYADGYYSYCAHGVNDELKIAHIDEMSLIDVWNSKNLLNFMKPNRDLFKNTKCETCKIFDSCSERRCYLRTLMTYNTLYDIDPMCPYSDVNIFTDERNYL